MEKRERFAKRFSNEKKSKINRALYLEKNQRVRHDPKEILSAPKFLKHYERYVKPPNDHLISENLTTLALMGKNGRLGNQLFQIAAVISYAKENNTRAIFSPWDCTYTDKRMSSFFKNKIEESLVLNPRYYYNEISFTHSPIPSNTSMIVHGYFQSEKYFENNKELIRKYFEPSDAVSSKIHQYYGNLLSGETCAIHIRRGDYVDHPIHYVCDLDYYSRGIRYMEGKKKIDKYFIFSDDIEWCRLNFRGNNFVYVTGNPDIEDLFLMSFCKNHVISNSSFSWWGSWLSTNPGKIIISPDRWFNPENTHLKSEDIFTKEMILL